MSGLNGCCFLIEELTRAKISMIEQSVNSKFKIVNWKLFSDLINGGLRECCEATVNGVPYSSVNQAGRIQAGIDIIDTFQAHYGAFLPIWVDGRESVIDLPETPAQTISLVVSEKHQLIEIKGA